MSSARSITHAPAEKMEISFGRAYRTIFQFKMAMHAVLLLSFGLSVKIKRRLGQCSNSVEFILVSAGMGFCLEEFI